MRRLYIVVEGQTEQEFINETLAPYLQTHNIYSVIPILINTSKTGKGGFVNFLHLEKTINGLLKPSEKNDFLVTTFVDFFRIPNNMPDYELCMSKKTREEQIAALEHCMAAKINDRRFIPYIQLHEFEALLFSHNKGFEYYYNEIVWIETEKIVNSFCNPEEINTTPEGAPSKRLLAINNNYNKVIEGNLIALEIGIQNIMNKCTRFSAWVDKLIIECKS
ncbi:DUF4276 family protein [Bacteroides sp. 519]|uniref:DUF4276 family protein n=1 Tax=Bacteroides sp. 519 TaxID=2302937 RepID=UPI0013D4C304|nr:DUF4276 family protein [Bacteroides sp. 519]NDV59915.1 DUF4276 family protein [Bacteroides sp. 519]